MYFLCDGSSGVHPWSFQVVIGISTGIIKSKLTSFSATAFVCRNFKHKIMFLWNYKDNFNLNEERKDNFLFQFLDQQMQY